MPGANIAFPHISTLSGDRGNFPFPCLENSLSSPFPSHVPKLTLRQASLATGCRGEMPLSNPGIKGWKLTPAPSPLFLLFHLLFLKKKCVRFPVQCLSFFLPCYAMRGIQESPRQNPAELQPRRVQCISHVLVWDTPGPARLTIAGMRFLHLNWLAQKGLRHPSSRPPASLVNLPLMETNLERPSSSGTSKNTSSFNEGIFSKANANNSRSKEQVFKLLQPGILQ